MNNITFDFLSETDVPEIYNAFQRAFADYEMDMSYLTEKIIKNRFLKNCVQYDCSVGAYSGKSLIGFTMVGINKFGNTITAFDAATGIQKEYRGKGVARDMFNFILPKLKEKKIERFILEVLQPNQKAIKAYSKTGFVIIREFRCYELFPGIFNYGNERNENILIRPVNKELIINFEREMAWLPSWENSVSGIMNIQDEIVSYGAFINDDCIGMLVYYPSLKWILNLIVNKNFRRKGIGRLLLTELVNNLSPDTKRICLHNVDKKDEDMQKFLVKCGFNHLIDQYEMELDINN